MRSTNATRTSFRVKAGLLYLLVLHLVLAVLVFKTDFLPKLKARLGIDTATTLHPYVRETIQYHQWIENSVPAQSVIFLGDSITQGLATAAVTAHATNLGIGHIDTSQLLQVLPQQQVLDRASVIVLTVGINDFLVGRKEGLIGRYQQIVDALPKGSALILNAVMPARHPRIKPQDILAFNHQLEALCRQRANCRYLDTWPLLADSSGQIIPEYFIADGMHLSAAGYGQWIGLLRTALAPSDAAAP